MLKWDGSPWLPQRMFYKRKNTLQSRLSASREISQKLLSVGTALTRQVIGRLKPGSIRFHVSVSVIWERSRNNFPNKISWCHYVRNCEDNLPSFVWKLSTAHYGIVTWLYGCSCCLIRSYYEDDMIYWISDIWKKSTSLLLSRDWVLYKMLLHLPC